MDSDCDVDDDTSFTFDAIPSDCSIDNKGKEESLHEFISVPMKKNYFHSNEVIEDLLQMIPDSFLLQFQTECLKKYASIKFPQHSEESSSEYSHRLEVQMSLMKDNINETIQQFGKIAIDQQENVHFGIHWTVSWIKGVAKQFVYCLLATLYKNNGMHILDELSPVQSNDKRQLCERALKVFENYLRTEHSNKWHKSLLNLSLIKEDKNNAIEKINKKKRKFLSVHSIEKYVSQATDFFIILGLLPPSYAPNNNRPLRFDNVTRTSNSPMTQSPKVANNVVVGAILESDIYRYIDKCIQNFQNNDVKSLLLPRSKKIKAIYQNNGNEFWIKLDDFYKWLLLLFVQATALKSESVVGTTGDATGALKIENVAISNGPNNSYKLTVHVTRLRTIRGGQYITLLSTNKRYCPVKMMMTWLAVRNVFKLPFSQCLEERNFEIKEESKNEWLFPESDQNGGIKSRVWSCNVLSNAVRHFAQTMKLQNLTVGSRSLRKGRVVQIYCKLIRDGFTAARARLCISLKNLPGWDGDVIYSQLKTPLYDDKTLCLGYDQLLINAEKNGTTAPDPLNEVPSLIDMAEEVVPEGFDKTEKFNNLFEMVYKQNFDDSKLEKKKNEITFLISKENQLSNPYSAKRLKELQCEIAYRMSATHKTDQKSKFRQQWLFKKYNRDTTTVIKQNVYKAKDGSIDLKAIANFPANFAEHCVGEIQGLASELCTYGSFKCPVKNCDEENIDVAHVSSHEVFECGKCIKEKHHNNFKCFKRHYTDYHVPTHFCISCMNYCSECPPHKRDCKASIAINRKYIRLFFSSKENELSCPCGSSEKCLRRNPKVLNSLNFAVLHAVANALFMDTENVSMSLSQQMRLVFQERIKRLVIFEDHECAMKLFDERIQYYIFDKIL